MALPFLLYISVHFSAIKRNKLLIHTAIWIGLKSILLNEKKLISKSYKMYDSILEVSDCQKLEKGKERGCDYKGAA